MRSDDIRPLSQHRARIDEDLRRVQETGRPLFITTKGRTAGVLLSPATYDDLAEGAALAEDIAALRQALAEARSGAGQDARQAIRGFAARIGVTLSK